MGADLFVDTSGLYSLADNRDPLSAKARQLITQKVSSRARLILTDYVLDEACTLTKARAGGFASLRLLQLVEASAGFRIEWIGPDRFDKAKAFFRKHSDHDYSFTDCTSFVVMQELRLTEALTTDHHFTEAGFQPLLYVR